MEAADIESLAEFAFGASSKLPDLEFSDFVPRRLPRPADIPVSYTHLTLPTTERV